MDWTTIVAHASILEMRSLVFSDVDFAREAEKYIWLSAYANNNPRSDYHWMADACYSEAGRRGKPDIYRKAWERASGEH